MNSIGSLQSNFKFDGPLNYSIDKSTARWDGYDSNAHVYMFPENTRTNYGSLQEVNVAISKWADIIPLSYAAANLDHPVSVSVYSVRFNDRTVLGTTKRYANAEYTNLGGADIAIDNGLSTYNDRMGTLVHEVGHALGLEHPDDDGYNPDWDKSMSIMSYNKLSNGSIARPVVSPMIFDIAAIQQTYNATGLASVGDNVYGSNVFDGSNRAWTLWDTAGNDTIDLSQGALNSIQNVKLDLRGGVRSNDLARFSEIGDERVAIAWQFGHNNQVGDNLAVQIEVAKGTQNADTIIGGMGANEIHGNSGDDVIVSGNKTDSVTVASADDGAVDTLDGGAGRDRIWAGKNDIWINDASNDEVYLNGTGSPLHMFAGKGKDDLYCFSGNNEIVEEPQDEQPFTLHINPVGTFVRLTNLTEGGTNHIFFGNQELKINQEDAYNHWIANTPIDVGQEWELFVKTDSSGSFYYQLYDHSGPDSRLVLEVDPYGANYYDDGFLGGAPGAKSFTQALTPMAEPNWLAPALAPTPATQGDGQVTGAPVTGTPGNDNILGITLSQSMSGREGNDTISGGGGMDTIDGGAGGDTLTGGVPGSTGDLTPDVFRFSDIADSQATSGANDRITDFYAAFDSIDVRLLGFTGITTSAINGGSTAGGLLRISYSTGSLRTSLKNDETGFTFMVNGNHFNSSTASENITADNFIFTDFTYKNGAPGSVNDNLTGTLGRDLIRGYEGNDVLSGGAGFDTLEGGAGADTLTGGAGADIFRFGATSDSSGTVYDRILDFNAAADRIDVRGMGFLSLTNNASTANATELRVTYNGTDRTFVKNDQTGFVFVMNGEHHVHDTAYPTGDIEQSMFLYS